MCKLPQIGDRIKFRSPTFHSGAPILVRKVKGFDRMGRILVRAHGYSEFIVERREVIAIVQDAN